MPLGTLDRDPPPFFRQGPSALSKLAVCSALALFLMVADARFKVMQPLRVGLAAVLYPVQWLAMQPIQIAQSAGQYFSSLRSAQVAKDDAFRKLGLQAQRDAQALFHSPQHPYTEALMASMPERSQGSQRLTTIPGMVPGLYDRPSGCLFGPRCSHAKTMECAQRPALQATTDGAVRCHFPLGSATHDQVHEVKV